MYLLDVNVLIAVLDPHHEHHDKVVDWFLANHRDGWATCPLTENGFIRIFGHRNYPNGPADTLVARRLLMRLCAEPGYVFWPDSVSLMDEQRFKRLPESKHLTDLYLLALAVENKGSLITLDRRIDASYVAGGEKAYSILTA